VIAIIPCLGMYAIPLTLLATIFGAVSLKKETGRGMAIAGLILGILGSVISVAQIATIVSARNNIEKQLKDPKVC
jgi:hypothetical protein